jgi:hypothetical protein
MRQIDSPLSFPEETLLPTDTIDRELLETLFVGEGIVFGTGTIALMLLEVLFLGDDIVLGNDGFKRSSKKNQHQQIYKEIERKKSSTDSIKNQVDSKTSGKQSTTDLHMSGLS